MYPVKTYYKETGLFDNIPIKVPSGKINDEESYYPFVLYFNSNSGFGKYVNQDVNLSIIYNFGGFKFGNKHSSYFNHDSDYYSSFYGAYAVKSRDESIFGFYDDGTINTDLISKIPEYDQKYLVMSSIGLPSSDVIFDYNIADTKECTNYIGYNGWIKVDSRIKTNAPIHKYHNHYRGYLQYGIPKDLKNNDTDYPVINMYGRMYVRYFKEYDSTIAFYILGKSEEIVDKIDENIVSKSYFKK